MHNKFRNLPYETLVDILLYNTRELLRSLEESNNEIEIQAMKKEVELVRSALIEKIASEQPLIGLSIN